MLGFFFSMLIYCNYSGLMEETQTLPLGMSSLMRGQMNLELSLLYGDGSLEPRSHQVGWVARGRFLGKVAFDSGFKRRKSSGWVEWGEGIPRKGVAVGTPTPGGESQRKSAPGRQNGCVRSPVLLGWQDRGKGKEGRGVLRKFQGEKEWFPPSEVGEQIQPQPDTTWDPGSSRASPISQTGIPVWVPHSAAM